MFSELFFVYLTIACLWFFGGFNILLGILLFSTLTYLCTSNYLEGSVDQFDNENVWFPFVNQHVFSIINLVRQFICSVRWWCLFVPIRKIFYILKSMKGDDTVNIGSQSIDIDRLQEDSLRQPAQGCSIPLSVDSEIKIIIDRILRDYIKSWYHSKISQNSQFISDVNCIIHDTLTAFCNGVSNIERKKICCHFIQLYLHFFFHFKEALNKVNSDQQNVLDICISKKKEILENFKMHHWAMKDKMTEWFYLQSMMSSLVDSYGPVEILSSPILHSMLVEILTRTIMYSLVNTLSDPERVNSWILKLFQNILKNESQFLMPFPNSSHKKESITRTDSAVDQYSHFKKPVILLSKDDPSKATQETCDSSYNYNIIGDHLTASYSSSKLFGSSTEKIADLSTDIFEYNISDASENSSQGLTDPVVRISNNDANQPFLLFPVVSTKAISNQNLSNKSLNLQESKESAHSDFMEVARIKRSRSADYIRQIQHLVSLMPLNNRSSNINMYGKKNKSPIPLRSNKHGGTDVEIAEEAIEKELPPLFTNVKIIETQQQEGSAGHSSYTLYCIQYVGMFQDISHVGSAPTLVRQTVVIKRRFREFLALQSRLEDNRSLKCFLKDVKGPSKWLATPFTNLDKKNVAERKPFLEKYLQDLCNQAEISKSCELQEFLAYGGDASIAFVKKSIDLSVPRLDKMIVRSVRGAFDLFRTAVPTPPVEAVISNEFGSQDSELEAVSDESSEPDFQLYIVYFSVSNPEILQEMEASILNFDDNSSSESSFDNYRGQSYVHKPILYYSLSISDHNGCNCMDIVTSIGSTMEENRLANVIIDFVVESFHQVPGPKTTTHIYLIKFLCGSILDNYITEKLDEISEERCAHLLHSFHKALWPDDKHNLKKGNKITNLPAILIKAIKSCHEDFLKTKWFGQQLHNFLGVDEVPNAIEMIIGSLQNEALNRCFLFYALDAINQVLCSKDF